MQSQNESQTNGSVIKPKHFIYLDRSRLFSYTAQFSDGLPQVRHLLESVNKSEINKDGERYKEVIKESKNEVEGSIGAKSVVGSVAANKEQKNSKKYGIKDGGSTTVYDALQALSEVKVEHDNLYLLLENDLLGAGLLQEINQDLPLNLQEVGLVKATGVTRFFDWEVLMKLYENPDPIISLFYQQELSKSNNKGGFQNKNNINKELETVKNQFKSLASLIRTFSIGNITLHMQANDLNLAASLNSNYLCMTLEQLRAGYVMAGDVEVTIVGFAPKRKATNTTFSGFAGQMNMSELWTTLVGEVNLTIDPIAVYSQINLE